MPTIKFVGFKSLQLVFVLSIFSLVTQADELPWSQIKAEPKNIEYKRSKDFSVGNYSFNTRDECTGNYCLPALTKITCAKHTEISYTPTTNIQFCHIDKIQSPGKPLQQAGENHVIAIGTIELNPDGKFKRYLPGVPSNVKWPETGAGMPIPLDESCDNCLVPDPTPTHAPVIADTVRAVNELAETVIAQVKTLAADEKKKIGQAFVNMPFGAACYGFITKEGELGDWGKEVVKQFKSVCSNCFFGKQTVDVKNICPKFNNFSAAQQEYFWAWAVSSIAHPESTCRTNVRVKGTKVRGHQEYAVGILQLEESYKRRRGRASECQTQGKETLYSTSFQFRCAASIIEDTRYNEGLPLGGTGRANQYWQKLISFSGSGGRITQFISKFPGCH